MGVPRIASFPAGIAIAHGCRTQFAWSKTGGPKHFLIQHADDATPRPQEAMDDQMFRITTMEKT